MILLLVYYFQLVATKCRFSVDCPDCLPYEVDIDPFPSQQNMCPHMAGQDLCCNSAQNSQLESNFRAIDATFGSAGGGCDVCAANLKRFWCEYTCSPRQAEFLTLHGYDNIRDPIDPAKQIQCQMVEIKVKPDVACNIWSSCKRTSFANQVTAMKSPSGFFNFQGENAVTQAKQYISVVFSEVDDSTIHFDQFDDCNQQFEKDKDGKMHTKEGFEITETCSCNNCDLSCAADDYLYEPTGVFEGFNTWLVISVWVGVIVMAAGITVIRKYCKKRDEFVQIL